MVLILFPNIFIPILFERKHPGWADPLGTKGSNFWGRGDHSKSFGDATGDLASGSLSGECGGLTFTVHVNYTWISIVLPSGKVKLVTLTGTGLVITIKCQKDKDAVLRLTYRM